MSLLISATASRSVPTSESAVLTAGHRLGVVGGAGGPLHPAERTIGLHRAVEQASVCPNEDGGIRRSVEHCIPESVLVGAVRAQREVTCGANGMPVRWDAATVF